MTRLLQELFSKLDVRGDGLISVAELEQEFSEVLRCFTDLYLTCRSCRACWRGAKTCRTRSWSTIRTMRG